jgi:predicted metal-dependent enzyme (double-stranded beta helix superfamily)
MTARSHHEVVAALAAAGSAAAAASEDPIERMHALEGPIAEAVRDPFWLAAPFRRVQGPGTYYLLWRDPASDTSLIAMVLGPADATPIHDHLTWGVVGAYEGVQRDTRYVTGPDGLRETSSVSREPGTVTTLLPPDDDIHFVRSESAGAPTISVFFMGSNLGCRPRHVFEDAGARQTIVSGYANAPCPGQTRSPFVVSQFM